MSDTSLSDAIPTDAELERSLRDAVRNAFTQGDRDSITVKRLRTKVETSLGLDEGFFKNDSTWKEKSKAIIQAEVEDHNNNERPSSSGAVPPNEVVVKKKPGPAARNEPPAKSIKRKSTDPPQSKPRKKRKNAPDNEGESNADDSGERSPPTKSRPKAAKQTSRSEEEESEIVGDEAVDAQESGASESEMSVVLDEDPKSKRKKPSSSASKPKTKKAENAKGKKASDAKADPDVEEIKRLQGWLVKCGIRKMWYKELAPYDTPKLKIKHLREMLADAGMTGRYSKEKADQIRDERELKADLEAVQEGEKTWGKSQSEDERSDADKKPRRRLARGLQGLDFLNDDDGEETD